MSDKDLTGRDMDAAVAVEVMGWHAEEVEGYGNIESHWYDANGSRLDYAGAFRPSVSWESMRLVIEEMARRGWDVQMSVHGPMSRAYFLRPAGTGMDVFAAFECHDAENAILPTAVCRAALAAVRAGKDGGA